MNVVEYISDTAFNAVIGIPSGVVDSVLHAGRAVTGVAASALSILTVGASRKINKIADLTNHSALILPTLYLPVLKVINPYTYADCNSSGIITAHTAIPIFRHAFHSTCKSDFLRSHVVSRIGFALGAAASLVTRVADLAIGLVAATFAIIPCLGRINSVNNFAMEQLMVFGLVDDICKGLRGIINPQQFKPAYRI